MSSKELLDDDEVFVRVGNSVETIRKTESITYDRLTKTGEGGDVPLLVFVGDETYRDRMEKPETAIGFEVMGTERWTIGFLDRTTDRCISLIDVDAVDNFFRMVRDVHTVKVGLSFPDSPEANACSECRGTDHMNHVVDLDADAGEAFIEGAEDVVGTEIHV